MIRSFSCKNFYSFGDEQTISFVVPSHKEGLTVKSKWGDGILTVLTAMGPNASGKTNMLKVLSFLSAFIQHYPEKDRMSPLPFMPFAFTDEQQPSEFAIEVENIETGTRYHYEVNMTELYIRTEYLFRKNIGGKWQRLIARKICDEQCEDYHSIQYESFIKKEFGIDKKLFDGALRSDASFFLVFNILKNNTLHDFFNLLRVLTNVSFSGRMDGVLTEKTHSRQLNFLYESKPIQKYLANFLEQMGTETHEIKIKRSPIFQELIEKARKIIVNDEKNIEVNFFVPQYDVHLTHHCNGKNYQLSLEHESRGIQELFYFTLDLLVVLRNGTVFAQDEIESGLHPLVLPHLIDLFTNSVSNRNHSQLICTCHALDLLRRLEKEQILLVEKNAHQHSIITRADSFKGLRRDDNYYAKYLAGNLGALPNISSTVLPTRDWETLCTKVKAPSERADG